MSDISLRKASKDGCKSILVEVPERTNNESRMSEARSPFPASTAFNRLCTSLLLLTWSIRSTLHPLTGNFPIHRPPPRAHSIAKSTKTQLFRLSGRPPMVPMLCSAMDGLHIHLIGFSSTKNSSIDVPCEISLALGGIVGVYRPMLRI